MSYHSVLHATCNSLAQTPSTVSFLFVKGSHPLPSQLPGGHTGMKLPLGTVNLFVMDIIPPFAITARYQFTPWLGGACMELASCPRMLYSQPTGSTEIQTHDLHIQSPTHYPFGHHISARIIEDICNTKRAGLLSPATMLFSRLIRGLLPPMNRDPINVNKDDLHNEALEVCQRKNDKSKDT